MLLRIFRNMIADISASFVVFLYIVHYEWSGKIRNATADNFVCFIGLLLIGVYV